MVFRYLNTIKISLCTIWHLSQRAEFDMTLSIYAVIFVRENALLLLYDPAISGNTDESTLLTCMIQYYFHHYYRTLLGLLVDKLWNYSIRREYYYKQIKSNDNINNNRIHYVNNQIDKHKAKRYLYVHHCIGNLMVACFMK